MAIRRFFKDVNAEIDFKPPATFKAELNRLSNAVVMPCVIMAIFSWILYIPLDKVLYPEFRLIVYLRLGLCLTGLVSFALHFTPYFKKNGHILVYIIMYYVEYATAVILGIVPTSAVNKSVYMGGFCIIILIVGLVPIQKFHAFFLLFSTLVIFLIVGYHYNITFKTSKELYGLYNVLISIAASIAAISFLDRIRKDSYEKSLVIYQTNEELKKANKLRRELLEIAAHDLKDPLQVIIGYTDLLLTKFQEDRFAVEKLRKMYRSTNQMVKLITGLLEIASIESGKLELNKVEVDVGEIAGGVVKNNRLASEKKNQEIIYNAEENCIINADRMLLQQVLENLVSNAIKFSPHGKSIWVSVKRKDSRVLIKVRDEGPGFTEEDKKKLFGRFQRLSAKPTGDESSSGLGLALTRELVKLHDGEIRLESQWEKGCEFIVELPLQELEPE